MKLFIDANILVAVINKEYPLFTYASRILSWATANGHQLMTTSVSLAITYYFAEKKHGTRSAKDRMCMLATRFSIVDCGAKEVQQATVDKNVNDFEDGLQYFAFRMHIVNKSRKLCAKLSICKEPAAISRVQSAMLQKGQRFRAMNGPAITGNPAKNLRQSYVSSLPAGSLSDPGGHPHRRRKGGSCHPFHSCLVAGLLYFFRVMPGIS